MSDIGPGAFNQDALALKLYLTAAEAAFYLGYTTATHTDPVRAFLAFARRHKVTHHTLGRRLRFRRLELEGHLAYRGPAGSSRSEA